MEDVFPLSLAAIRSARNGEACRQGRGATGSSPRSTTASAIQIAGDNEALAMDSRLHRHVPVKDSMGILA